MKKYFVLTTAIAFVVLSACGQGDKSKRPSPPAKASETTGSGNSISIDYSQPAVKGRTIGKDIAPYGEVWRTGANEATVFEISKDATIEGKALPAGKYGLYSIPGEKEWVFIFSKKWNVWGTVYNESDDALRVKVPAGKSAQFMERMTFTIGKDGKVSLVWGNTEADFIVK